jgi:toxin ParE1/3/4
LVEAEEDVRASVEWYEGRRQGLGSAFFDAVTDAFQAIEVNPQRYPKVIAKDLTSDVRTYSLVKFPFAVIYEIRPDETIVLAVAHHKRRPDYWTRRRL